VRPPHGKNAAISANIRNQYDQALQAVFSCRFRIFRKRLIGKRSGSTRGAVGRAELSAAVFG
jgi:hypothetical protein